MDKTVSKILIIIAALMLLLAVIPWVLLAINKADTTVIKHNKYELPEILIDEHISNGVDLSESIMRPLFWVQRKPFVSSDNILDADAALPANYNLQLLGFLVKDDIKQAWIKADDIVNVVQEGDSISGWTITTLAAGTVTLVRDNEELVLPEKKEQSETISLHRID